MKHIHRLHRYSRSSSEPETIYEIHEQAWWPRLQYLAFLGWWNVSWRFKPVAFIIDDVVEPILRRRHQRDCNHDCVEGTDREMNSIRLCGRMPLTNHWDCVLYEYDQRKSITVATAK